MHLKTARFLLLTASLIAAVGLLATSPAQAFINAEFTPLHLMEQSDLVLVIKFAGTPKDGKVTATVTKALKGEAPAKPMKFDLFAGAFEAQGKAIAKVVAQEGSQALFFVGFYEDQGGGGDPGAEEAATGMLHIAGKWIIFSSFEEGLWDMEKIDSRMLGTWAGSTDMLLRAVNYILADESADVPVKSNVEWGKHSKFGQVPGKVSFAKPVDLAGDGKVTLHVGSDAGDRLFRLEGGKLTDVTAKHKLTSRSKLATWADFNDDGRLDLLSSDGEKLQDYWQAADGTFDHGPMAEIQKTVLSLSTVRSGGKAPVVVIGTPDGVRLMAKGKLMLLQTGGVDFGPGGECFVADFDGDALPDILQMFAAGGLFYKGLAPGTFAPVGVKTQIAFGKGEHTSQIGDYDNDGLLDIFCSAEDRNRLWHNLGHGKFIDMLSQSGEIAYISKSGGVSGMTGDVNNDGRQDILIGYSGMSPQIFFNRGFRSFGHARMVDLADLKLLPQAGEGQQTVCLADLNADGAQDMVVVLKSGACWFFPRAIAGDAALSVSVTLARGKKLCEPVRVTGWRRKRCIGTWTLTEGGAPAFFGLQEASAVTLKWQFPGAAPQQKKVRVIDKAVRVTLTP